MIFRSAYDTMACHGFNMKRTIDALNIAMVSGGLNMVDGKPVYCVQGGQAWANDIPAFAHPVIIQNHNKEEAVVFDARSYGHFNEERYEFMIRNSIEYNLHSLRATLNHIWINESPNLLRDVSKSAMAAFSSWISEAVSRRFSLDPRQQLDLAILSAVYYASLFNEKETRSEDDSMRVVNTISVALRVSASDVLSVMDKVSVVQDIKHFCQCSAEVTGSVRLSEMNVGLLFAILGGTWFGTHAKEMVAVALEHPPTWLAILASACTERSFKNSPIARIMERTGGKNGADDYFKALNALVASFSTNK